MVVYGAKDKFLIELIYNNRDNFKAKPSQANKFREQRRRDKLYEIHGVTLNELTKDYYMMADDDPRFNKFRHAAVAGFGTLEQRFNRSCIPRVGVTGALIGEIIDAHVQMSQTEQARQDLPPEEAVVMEAAEKEGRKAGGEVYQEAIKESKDEKVAQEEAQEEAQFVKSKIIADYQRKQYLGSVADTPAQACSHAPNQSEVTNSSAPGPSAVSSEVVGETAYTKAKADGHSESQAQAIGMARKYIEEGLPEAQELAQQHFNQLTETASQQAYKEAKDTGKSESQAQAIGMARKYIEEGRPEAEAQRLAQQHVSQAPGSSTWPDSWHEARHPGDEWLHQSMLHHGLDLVTAAKQITDPQKMHEFLTAHEAELDQTDKENIAHYMLETWGDIPMNRAWFPHLQKNSLQQHYTSMGHGGKKNKRKTHKKQIPKHKNKRNTPKQKVKKHKNKRKTHKNKRKTNRKQLKNLKKVNKRKTIKSH